MQTTPKNAQNTEKSPAEHVRQVLCVTVAAWGVRPESPRAVARRAPHGYEPLRARRRRFFEAARALGEPQRLAHSW